MGTPTNHRRDRQQTRRILADIRIRCRDLTGSILPTEIDLPNGQSPPCVFRHPSGIKRNSN